MSTFGVSGEAVNKQIELAKEAGWTRKETNELLAKNDRLLKENIKAVNRFNCSSTFLSLAMIVLAIVSLIVAIIAR